jgi:hypothetical protein
VGGRRLDGGGEGGGGQKLMRSVAVKLVGPKYLGGVGFEVPKRCLQTITEESILYLGSSEVDRGGNAAKFVLDRNCGLVLPD